MKRKNIVKEIDSIKNSIAQTALTMRDCNHVGEFEFHAKALERQVQKLGDLSTEISGSGTGNE